MNICLFAFSKIVASQDMNKRRKESEQGPHEKRLLNKLLNDYNVLERPVANESEPLLLSFGLTLQQIIDVNLRRVQVLLDDHSFKLKNGQKQSSSAQKSASSEWKRDVKD
ncbi:hypothetical protein AVEN_273851-1 [Araneus ventricosus]|uniref:Neurotransmitter-gated ion-channel ligand-binding domain-containing protein n=1 Tax=Araneus ventricosus TaxID=182803 RepID=A0A4Y2QRD8_ARAVE|nr:hypothetical protein AVEN_271326-1 [Araneus ventricosus]GBN65820.1 hypothetical protein AVEN_273851-1 [Araneus ventricosus]